MKLSEALEILRNCSQDSVSYQVDLACGFTPLAFETFLAAHLQQRLPHRRVSIRSGLYGDLLGTLRRTASSEREVHAIAVACEWTDLDPRLGYRNLGGWGPGEEGDIVRHSRASTAALLQALRDAREGVPVALSPPTLPLPPVFHTVGWQAGRTSSALAAIVAEFIAEASAMPDVAIVHAPNLDLHSPISGRFDLRSDLLAGSPYATSHASAVAEMLARLLAPAPVKKGIITDLDDTFWKGLVGEVGPDAVSWDLDGQAHLHGLYQQVLRALADQGVLVAIASKNDPRVADVALSRADLIMPKEKLYPIEAHWHPKSGSIRRILSQWNVSADSVVFVDDSPMELGEVKQAFPKMECLPFPKDDYLKMEAFLRGLRDRFGKPWLSEEDGLRRNSLRGARAVREALQGVGVSEDFVRGLDAVVTIDHDAKHDPRVLELMNKTNQFHLNGRRYEASEWTAAAKRNGAFVWSIAYRDKFGPLGKIAVLSGLQQGQDLIVEGWAMSCRAFTRRVEHQCVRQLFEIGGVEAIVFRFTRNDRNGPLRVFLKQLVGSEPEGDVRLRRSIFLEQCPSLFHTVQTRAPTASKGVSC